MKTKSYMQIFPLIVVGVLLVLTNSCKKDNNDNNVITPIGQVPLLTTSSVTGVTGTKATCGGYITDDEGLTVTARGVCWSTEQTLSISDSKTSDGTGAGDFTSTITGLTPFTTYYVRAYATNSAGTGYGSAMSFTTSEPTLGDNYQGGIIAYILKPGEDGYIAGEIHGLIAAPSDQSTGIQWNNGNNTLTGATSVLFGAGLTNTNTIVASQGDGNYAAKLCYDLVLGGYSDWHLPSYIELINIYPNKDVIGGFTGNTYWTSTEYQLNTAVFIDFNSGISNTTSKSVLYYVHAVRYF